MDSVRSEGKGRFSRVSDAVALTLQRDDIIPGTGGFSARTEKDRICRDGKILLSESGWHRESIVPIRMIGFFVFWYFFGAQPEMPLPKFHCSI